MFISKELLLTGCDAIGLSLDGDAADRFDAYARLLVEYNNKVNLTAITAPDEVAWLHFLDSLALQTLTDFRGKRVIDVGCGAGFPGSSIDAGSGSYVLKRAKAFELETYRCFFRDKKPYAPAFFGSCAFGGAEYFLMEYCPGEDLRRCEREKLRKALDALIEMQDEFWQREELYASALTLEQSLVGVENRGRYLGSKRLEEVYAAFVKIC